MAPINPQSVHIDEALSEFSLAYMQSADKFVAWRVFPNLTVSKQTNRYWQFPRQWFWTEGFTKRSPGSVASEVHYEVDNTPSYYCDVWHERTPILHQVVSNADRMIDPENLATKLLTTHAMIKLEKDWVATYFQTGVWTTQRTGVSGVPNASQVRIWDDYVNSDPLEDIEKLKVVQGELTGYEPNKLVIGRKVWKALKNHPDIVDRIKYGQTPGSPARVTRQAVAQLMELDEILVCSSVQNTAKMKATPAYSYIAGNHALLTYAPGTVGWMEPVAAVKFSWDQEAPGTNEQGGAIRRYDMTDSETEYAELKMSYDMKVVAADLSCFISGVVSG